MGNPCIFHTGQLSSITAPLQTSNLSKNLQESNLFKVPKQQKLSSPYSTSKKEQFATSKARPSVNVSITASSNFVSNLFSSSAHSITTGIKHSVPVIPTLGSQFVNQAEVLFNHITTLFNEHGTVSDSPDQVLEALASTFGDYFHIASINSPTIYAAAVLIPLIALKSSANEEDFPPLSHLRTLRGKLKKLLVSSDGFAKKKNFQIEEDAEEALPLQYDPEAIIAYYKNRPFLVFSRAAFILLECSLLLVNVLMDFALGKAKQNETLRASQLVDLIARLGPTAIKVGQALSIRPDILPPAYIEELQKLQDNVPSFSNEEARATLLEGLGFTVEDIFCEFSDEPIAAASLGQVRNS